MGNCRSLLPAQDPARVLRSDRLSGPRHTTPQTDGRYVRLARPEPRPPEEAAGDRYCATVGTVVSASDIQVQALHVEPGALCKDQGTVGDELTPCWFGQSSRVNELMSPDWPIATFYSVEYLYSADILRVSQPFLTEDVCLKNKQNPCKQRRPLWRLFIPRLKHPNDLNGRGPQSASEPQSLRALEPQSLRASEPLCVL